MTPVEAREIRQSLEELLVSPGWAFIRDRIEKMAANEFMKMRNAADQSALLKATYTHIALKDLLDFPEMALKTLTGSR